MRTSWKLASVALLLAFGVSVGFGWGNVTHVWFADKLGVRSGPLNQNEIYGSLLPDLYGYMFTNNQALAAEYALHTEGALYWAFSSAAMAVDSRDARAAGFGMFTHSNAPEIKGADWYAHGAYPYPGTAWDPNGWVVAQGNLLADQPRIKDYVNSILPVPQLAAAFFPIVGHTLIETAVDILVKENEDPMVGGKLYLAATNRSDVVPVVFANVIAGASDQFPSAENTIAWEASYRNDMMLYGQLFTLPEEQIVAIISEQTAILAHSYLEAVFAASNLDPQTAPEVEKDSIAKYIGLAIDQVAPIYHAELVSTLNNVDKNLKKIHVTPAGPVFAQSGKDVVEDEFGGIQSLKPAEFALDQNYPNPFNPTTTIAFALPSDQVVTLKIYNAIGQEVATLVNEFKTAGRYSAVWDAKGIPSGVYFCRLQAGNVVELKKMTLLK